MKVGGTLPSFEVSFALYLVLRRVLSATSLTPAERRAG